MSRTRYHKVDNFAHEVEEKLLEQGKHVRNYGRLNRWYMDALARGKLEDGDPHVVLDRPRPWRLQNFLRNLAPHASYGEISHRNYTLRVMNAGIEDALGRGKSSDQLEELLSPWKQNEHSYWENFQFHKELIGTSLINLLPDRSFALYVYAKDAVGDDAPVFYMELEVGRSIDRHVMVWELDQVMVKSATVAQPHEASEASEYASAYQKLYFYLNWEEKKPRYIIRVVVSDLPKVAHKSWDAWLGEMHKSSHVDAFVAISILILSSYYGVFGVGKPWVAQECGIGDYQGSGEGDSSSVALIAGIVVAGIASEEWLSPFAIILGAISRFYANESLTLRVHYRASISLSVKRVIITLLATASELGPYVSSTLGIDYAFRDRYAELNAGRDSSETYLAPICGSDMVLIIGAIFNVMGLMQSAYAGVYDGFSHSDFPAVPSIRPVVYVAKEAQHFKQILGDCRAVEEYCSVFRPILHWQQGVNKRFLGDAIDLAAPGSPPSFLSYCLATPATSRIAVRYAVYGGLFRFWLLPLAFVEQMLAAFGGIFILLLDLPVVLVLTFSLGLKTLGIPRSATKGINTFALKLYLPADYVLALLEAYNERVADWLDMQTMECRGRSTARLYRLPLIQAVRTGRTSNHAWKFGDYLPDSSYYRCSDMVVVNPRSCKLAIINAGNLFYNRHKLLWTTVGGTRYENPCLACGDNSVSHRSSLEGQQDPEEALHVSQTQVSPKLSM
ncbi:Hypothetical Protein FCC1311_092732 [Hondaea fermentalgiana]|uniref:Uncharacterized protein n=1 Tax=Hondaea fermentalgiana TaxID=2315210 RepID=A0A2R5GRW7_9STRA|nr:Hypothetical Protein FCC1311_092732 [Hondaea fermentalgiana]|eukprot:GBG33049.1 Hypothetical Protein FCC1311_092732 [Hondaea fermentalgiana]